MFTGIIEELGKIQKVEARENFQRLTIAAKLTLEETVIGASISVNGVCLTVVEKTKDGFSFEVMPESWNLTNLQFLKKGEEVNLERALRADSRLGGHFVSGHIDGLVEIREKRQSTQGLALKVKTPAEFMPLIYQKGSLALDGVSLTIAAIGEQHFTVYLIGHTLAKTTLGFKQKGDLLNLEVDLLARYAQKKESQGQEKTKINSEFLRRHGFI
jgi:riboflavin synthase